MRWLGCSLAVISALMASAGAAAQQICTTGTTNLFDVTKFDARIRKQGYMDSLELSVTLLNSSDHSLRMIDGSVVFQDILGRDVIRIAIEPDAKVPARGTFTQSGSYSNLRLAAISPEDVVATVCVRGAVTTTGEVLRFDVD